jgi:neutral trehalase
MLGLQQSGREDLVDNMLDNFAYMIDTFGRFGDNQNLWTVRTTSIIPVDLNSLLFHLETTIARGCTITRDFGCVAQFIGYAARRAEGINRYLWNNKGYYGDYDWQLGKARDNQTPAMLYPLMAGIAWPERASKTAQTVQNVLLKEGGLATSTYDTTQQWDAPNGWAPLHWIAIQGLADQRLPCSGTLCQDAHRSHRSVCGESTHPIFCFEHSANDCLYSVHLFLRGASYVAGMA